MGKLKGHAEDWLEEYGYRLGYDMSNLPDIGDFWWIVDNNVEATTYWKGKWKGDK